MERRLSVYARCGVSFATVVLSALAADASRAAEDTGNQGWEPTRNVVMIVPAGAGGGTDIMSRAMAAGFEEVRPGVNVTVENYPGGGTAQGYAELLTHQGEPHYLAGSEATLLSLPLTTETPYHWTDFTPIAQIAFDAGVIAVRDDSPFESLQDVIDAAKQREVLAGIATPNGPDAITLELLSQDQGVEFRRVVYSSGGESTTALLAGDVDFIINNPGELAGQLEGGSFRALAVFADERYTDDLMADVPTSVEQGVDVTFAQYRALMAPGDITDAQRAYWTEAVVDWTETEGFEEYITTNLLDPEIKTGQEFEDFLNEYEETMKGVVGDLGD